MADYTLVQCPELSLAVPGKNSDKTRRKATEKLIELINTGKLLINLPEGFSPRQLIEIREEYMGAEGEDKIIEAVKILHNLAASKAKVEELRERALTVRSQIDILFSAKPIQKEEFEKLKKGLKVLQDFAKANSRYKESLPQAEHARAVIDEALKNNKTD